jgi:hypothetical protein
MVEKEKVFKTLILNSAWMIDQEDFSANICLINFYYMDYMDNWNNNCITL